MLPLHECGVRNLGFVGFIGLDAHNAFVLLWFAANHTLQYRGSCQPKCLNALQSFGLINRYESKRKSINLNPPFYSVM